MSLETFYGLGIAVVTPFTKDLSIDFNSLRNIINFQIDNGADYLVALGTTAETATLSDIERKEVTACFIETVNKRVPIIVGVGGNNTQAAVDEITTTNWEGVDAFLVVTPYYSKPTQKGLYRHYESVVSSTNLPVILYNVPSRTGVNMTTETTLSIARNFKNVVAIKEASGCLEQTISLCANKPEDFVVISGDDKLTLPMIACGAKGVISVLGNAYPKEMGDIVNNALNGDYDKSREILYKFSSVIDMLFDEGNPCGVKAFMKELGLLQNKLRLPLVPVGDVLYNEISDFVANN